jgi:hypothetical protein
LNLKVREHGHRKCVRWLAHGMPHAEFARALYCGYSAQSRTLAAVGALVEMRVGRVCGTMQVWRLLRSLGILSQRAIGRVVQRDETVILQWQNRRSPV